MKYKKNVYRALAMISQFGINMLVPIFICSFIGIYLDKKLGTSFWMIVLFFVGAVAGARNIFVFARKIYTSGEMNEKQDKRSRKNSQNK